MLIVCNGPYKTGSTWIFSLLLEALGEVDAPARLRATRQGRNLDLVNHGEAVLELAAERPVVVKAHCYDAAVLDHLASRGVRFVITRRPLEEVLESHYHHFVNEKFAMPYIVYALSVGLVKAIESVLYESTVARSAADTIVVDFRELRASPAIVLARVLEWIPAPLDEEEIRRACDALAERGRDYATIFPDQADRGWFLRRAEVERTRTQRAVASGVGVIARAVARTPIVRVLVLRTLLAIPSRRQYRRLLEVR